MTTYYVDGAVGNDGNAGTSEGAGNAWATIDHAMNTVVAGDRVYVKATGTYSETPLLDTAGTPTAPIEFVGYTTTPGDDGKVTISGTTNCLAVSVASAFICRFHNFIFDGGSSHAVDLGNADQVFFFNCEFKNAGGAGCFGDDKITFYKCIFANNTTFGADVDLYAHFFCCKAYGNGDIQLNAGTSNLCMAYGNLVYGVPATKTGIDDAWLAINNTVDCEGNATTTGIGLLVDSNHGKVAFNNLVHDAAKGLGGVGNIGTVYLTGYNVFTNVTTDYEIGTGLYSTGLGDVTGSDPGFTDEASDDYTLASGSVAKDAGFGVE